MGMFRRPSTTNSAQGRHQAETLCTFYWQTEKNGVVVYHKCANVPHKSGNHICRDLNCMETHS